MVKMWQYLMIARFRARASTLVHLPNESNDNSLST